MSEHLKKFQFQKGQSGNPKGRPPTGRQHFLTLLDAELAKQGDKFVKNLVKAGNKRPIQFARDVIIPLMDKQMLVSAKDGEGKVAVWKCLVEFGLSQENADIAMKEIIDVPSKEVPVALNP